MTARLALWSLKPMSTSTRCCPNLFPQGPKEEGDELLWEEEEKHSGVVESCMGACERVTRAILEARYKWMMLMPFEACFVKQTTSKKEGVTWWQRFTHRTALLIYVHIVMAVLVWYALEAYSLYMYKPIVIRLDEDELTQLNLEVSGCKIRIQDDGNTDSGWIGPPCMNKVTENFASVQICLERDNLARALLNGTRVDDGNNYITRTRRDCGSSCTVRVSNAIPEPASPQEQEMARAELWRDLFNIENNWEACTINVRLPEPKDGKRYVLNAHTFGNRPSVFQSLDQNIVDVHITGTASTFVSFEQQLDESDTFSIARSSINVSRGLVQVVGMRVDNLSVTSESAPVSVHSINSMTTSYCVGHGDEVCLGASKGIEKIPSGSAARLPGRCNGTAANATCPASPGYSGAFQLLNKYDFELGVGQVDVVSDTGGVSFSALDKVDDVEDLNVTGNDGCPQNPEQAVRLQDEDREVLLSILKSGNDNSSTFYDYVVIKMMGQGAPQSGFYIILRGPARLLYTIIEPPLLDALSVNLLNPRFRYLNLTLNPGFCPDIPYLESGSRRVDAITRTYTVLRDAIGENMPDDARIGFRDVSHQVFVSDLFTGLFVTDVETGEAVFVRDAPTLVNKALFALSMLAIAVPICCGVIVCCVGIKLAGPRIHEKRVRLFQGTVEGSRIEHLAPQLYENPSLFELRKKDLHFAFGVDEHTEKASELGLSTLTWEDYNKWCVHKRFPEHDVHEVDVKESPFLRDLATGETSDDSPDKYFFGACGAKPGNYPKTLMKYDNGDIHKSLCNHNYPLSSLPAADRRYHAVRKLRKCDEYGDTLAAEKYEGDEDDGRAVARAWVIREQKFEMDGKKKIVVSSSSQFQVWKAPGESWPASWGEDVFPGWHEKTIVARVEGPDMNDYAKIAVLEEAQECWRMICEDTGPSFYVDMFLIDHEGKLKKKALKSTKPSGFVKFMDGVVQKMKDLGLPCPCLGVGREAAYKENNQESQSHDDSSRRHLNGSDTSDGGNKGKNAGKKKKKSKEQPKESAKKSDAPLVPIVNMLDAHKPKGRERITTVLGHLAVMWLLGLPVLSISLFYAWNFRFYFGNPYNPLTAAVLAIVITAYVFACLVLFFAYADFPLVLNGRVPKWLQWVPCKSFVNRWLFSPFVAVLRKIQVQMFYIFLAIVVCLDTITLMTVTMWILMGVIVRPEKAIPYFVGIVGVVGNAKSLKSKIGNFQVQAKAFVFKKLQTFVEPICEEIGLDRKMLENPKDFVIGKVKGATVPLIEQALQDVEVEPEFVSVAMDRLGRAVDKHFEGVASPAEVVERGRELAKPQVLLKLILEGFDKNMQKKFKKDLIALFTGLLDKFAVVMIGSSNGAVLESIKKEAKDLVEAGDTFDVKEFLKFLDPKQLAEKCLTVVWKRSSEEVEEFLAGTIKGTVSVLLPKSVAGSLRPLLSTKRLKRLVRDKIPKKQDGLGIVEELPKQFAQSLSTMLSDPAELLKQLVRPLSEQLPAKDDKKYAKKLRVLTGALNGMNQLVSVLAVPGMATVFGRYISPERIQSIVDQKFSFLRSAITRQDMEDFKTGFEECLGLLTPMELATAVLNVKVKSIGTSDEKEQILTEVVKWLTLPTLSAYFEERLEMGKARLVSLQRESQKGGGAGKLADIERLRSLSSITTTQIAKKVSVAFDDSCILEMAVNYDSHNDLFFNPKKLKVVDEKPSESKVVSFNAEEIGEKEMKWGLFLDPNVLLALLVKWMMRKQSGQKAGKTLMSVVVLSELDEELKKQVPEMRLKIENMKTGKEEFKVLSDFFDQDGVVKPEAAETRLSGVIGNSIQPQHHRRGRLDFLKRMAGVKKKTSNAEVSVAAMAQKEATKTEPPSENTLVKTLHGVWERVLTDYGLAAHQLVYIVTTATLLLAAILSFIFIGFSVFTETDDPVGALINSLMTLGAAVGVNKQQGGNSDKDGVERLGEIVFTKIKKYLLSHQHLLLQIAMSLVTGGGVPDTALEDLVGGADSESSDSDSDTDTDSDSQQGQKMTKFKKSGSRSG